MMLTPWIALLKMAVFTLAHNLRPTCNDSCTDSYVSNSVVSNDNGYMLPPTVDVFYLFLNPGKHTPYITHGYFWILPWIAKNLAREKDGRIDTRIHVVSNDDEIVHFAQQYGYHSYNINPYMAEDNHLLSKIRKSLHGTVSPYEYEVTIYRWIVFHRVVESWNNEAKQTEKITRILVLDGDVLLSVNAAQFYHNVLLAFTKPHDIHDPFIRNKNHDDLGYELIGVALGVCNLFSSHGLKSFANFLHSWFAGSTEEVVRRSKDIGGVYFSDMELYKQFIKLDNSTRNGCIMFEKETCFQKLIQCQPEYSIGAFLKEAKTPQFYINGKPVVNDNWQEMLHVTTNVGSPLISFGIQSEVSQQPLCFLHFQGREIKNAMIVFGRAMENVINAYKRGTLKKFEVSFATHDLVVQPLHSRELFLINATDGKKYSIGTMDAFYHRNYSVGNIIPHIPRWLLHLFPYSGVMDENAPVEIYRTKLFT